jgi:hypothetical protein
MKNHRIRLAGIVAIAILILAACSTPATPVRDVAISSTSAVPLPPVGPATAKVLDAVKAAQDLKAVPDSIAASLGTPDEAGAQNKFGCNAVDDPANANNYGECAYGDPNGSKLMVIYGDSRAKMWAATLEGVAAKNGYKLRVFSLGGCSAPDLNFMSPQTKSAYKNCDVFHDSGPEAIKALHPDVVLTTSLGGLGITLADGTKPTAEQWQQGWTSTLNKLAQPGTRLAMLGTFPAWPQSGARCLAAHVNAVQQCSVPAQGVVPANMAAEQAAASAAGALYVSTTPYVCQDRCEPVIADMRVFNDPGHFTQAYAVYLTDAVNEALQPALR